jgi:hypothetical protein
MTTKSFDRKFFLQIKQIQDLIEDDYDDHLRNKKETTQILNDFEVIRDRIEDGMEGTCPIIKGGRHRNFTRKNNVMKGGEILSKIFIKRSLYLLITIIGVKMIGKSIEDYSEMLMDIHDAYDHYSRLFISCTTNPETIGISTLGILANGESSHDQCHLNQVFSLVTNIFQKDTNSLKILLETYGGRLNLGLNVLNLGNKSRIIASGIIDVIVDIIYVSINLWEKKVADIEIPDIKMVLPKDVENQINSINEKSSKDNKNQISLTNNKEIKNQISVTNKM